MTRIKLLLLAVIAVLLTGCGAWKPIVKTVDDIARFHCASFYSARQKVSLEDAWEAYCKTREAWAPWIDPVLSAKQAGDEQAEADPIELPAGE